MIDWSEPVGLMKNTFFVQRNRHIFGAFGEFFVMKHVSIAILQLFVGWGIDPGLKDVRDPRIITVPAG